MTMKIQNYEIKIPETPLVVPSEYSKNLSPIWETWAYLLRDYVNYQILPIFIVIIANVLLSLPFAIHIIQSKMQQLNVKHKKICLSLGISGLNRFMKIDFPALRPQVGFAMGLSACLSIGDLSVIALFGNQNFRNWKCSQQ